MGVSSSGTELVAPVITEIVLKRGWSQTKASSLPASVSVEPRKVNALELDGSVSVFKKAPAYKSMTRLVVPEKIEFKKVEKPNAFTLEEFDQAMERSVEKFLTFFSMYATQSYLKGLIVYVKTTLKAER